MYLLGGFSFKVRNCHYYWFFLLLLTRLLVCVSVREEGVTKVYQSSGVIIFQLSCLFNQVFIIDSLISEFEV